MTQYDDLEPRDGATVHQLIVRQFPQFSDRELVPLESGATDNVVHRLGRDLLVRLPRNADAARRIEKEVRWLPDIGRQVSVAIPDIVGVGRPDLGFAHTWTVQRWTEGRDATSDAPGDWPRAARSLGRTVNELRAMAATGGPTPGATNSFRGCPLVVLDERVRGAAAFWAEEAPRHEFMAGVDVDRVLDVWRDALDAPAWTGAPTWVHGDLLPGNVLLAGDDLAAVIDFGCAGVGDPACDTIPAWTLFRGRAREEFLAITHLDDATHRRARGWVAYMGVTAMPYHHLTNPAFCVFARRALDELLAAP